MNPSPKISIIMPVFDEAEYLVQCFESLLEQTYKNFEVLVSDNASSDNTWEMIQKYQNKYPQFFKGHHFEKPVHPFANLNHCVEMSTGDLCYHFGGDDYLKNPDFLEQAVKPFMADPKLAGHFTRLEYFDSSNNQTLMMNPPEEVQTWLSLGLYDFVKVYLQNTIRDDMFVAIFPRKPFADILKKTYRFSAESAGWWIVLQVAVEAITSGKHFIFDSQRKCILMKRVNKDPQAKVKSKTGAGADKLDPPGFRLLTSLRYSFQTASLVADDKEQLKVLFLLLFYPRKKSSGFPSYLGPAVAFLFGGYFWARLYMRSRDMRIPQVILKKLKII